MADKPKRFHVLPTAKEPHAPGIWDHGDGTWTVYPYLDPDTLDLNREYQEAQGCERLIITSPDASAQRVAGIHFHGFDEGLTRNRYAATELLNGLQAAISLARWLDCQEYGGEWPWADQETAEPRGQPVEDWLEGLRKDA